MKKWVHNNIKMEIIDTGNSRREDDRRRIELKNYLSGRVHCLDNGYARSPFPNQYAIYSYNKQAHVSPNLK